MAQQTLAVGSTPLGVAFGADGLALVLTTTDISLLDPSAGALTQLTTITAVNSLILPTPAGNFPPQITTASLGVSGDLQTIYGVTNSILFTYSVAAHAVTAGGYTATPTLGPRLISVNNDGSMYIAGWAAFSKKLGAFAYQRSPGHRRALLSGGSHAIDSAAGLVYAQIPNGSAPAPPPTTSTQCLANGVCVTVTVPPPAGTPPPTAAAPPTLMISDLDNFNVRQLRADSRESGRAFPVKFGLATLFTRFPIAVSRFFRSVR